jgi:hypothetical protein
MSEVNYYLVEFYQRPNGELVRDYKTYENMQHLYRDAARIMALPDGPDKPVKLKVQIETMVEYDLPYGEI